MLRWIRGLYLKLSPLVLAVYAMVIIWSSETWALVLLAVSLAIGVESVISLSLRIRREERRER